MQYIETNTSNTEENTIQRECVPDTYDDFVDFESLTKSNDSMQQDEYNDLLKTIFCLKTEIQQNAFVIREMKEENTNIRQNYEDTKSILENTRTRYEESRTSLLEQLEVATRREKIFDEKDQKWKKEAEERRKELERREDELRRNEIKSNIQKTKEEVEKYESKKIPELKSEIETWRTKFYETKRDYEVYKAKYDVASTSVADDVSSADRGRQTEILTLKEELNKYILSDGRQDSNTKMTDIDGQNLMTLNLKIERMKVKEDKLSRELREVRAARDNLEVSCNEEKSSSHQKLVDIHAKIAYVESENSEMKHELIHLKNENDRLIQSNRELSNGNSNMKSEMNSLKHALSTSDELSQNLRQKLESEHQQSSDNKKSKEALYNEKLLEAKNDRDVACDEMSRIKTELRNQIKEITISSEVTRRELREHIVEITNKNANMKKILESKDEEHRRMESEYFATVKKLMHACECTKMESNLAMKEKDIMSKNISAIHSSMEELKTSLNSVEKELDDTSNKKIILEKKNEQISQFLKDSESSNKLLKIKLETVVKEHIKVQKEYDKKTEITISNKVKELERIQSQLSKEKKKSEAYKEKALQAQRKAKHMKEMYSLNSNLNVFESDVIT